MSFCGMVLNVLPNHVLISVFHQLWYLLDFVDGDTWEQTNTDNCFLIWFQLYWYETMR